MGEIEDQIHLLSIHRIGEFSYDENSLPLLMYTHLIITIIYPISEIKLLPGYSLGEKELPRQYFDDIFGYLMIYHNDGGRSDEIHIEIQENV